MISIVDLQELFSKNKIEGKFEAQVNQQEDGSYRFQASFNNVNFFSVDYGDAFDEWTAIIKQELTNSSEYLPIPLDSTSNEINSAIDKVEIEKFINDEKVEDFRWNNVEPKNVDRIGIGFLKEKYNGSDISMTKEQINLWITTQMKCIDYYGLTNELLEPLLNRFSETNDAWIQTAVQSIGSIRVNAEQFIADKFIVVPSNAMRV